MFTKLDNFIFKIRLKVCTNNYVGKPRFLIFAKISFIFVNFCKKIFAKIYQKINFRFNPSDILWIASRVMSNGYLVLILLQTKKIFFLGVLVVKDRIVKMWT
jgi:hypothetical protein